MVPASRHSLLSFVGFIISRGVASQKDICPTTCMASGPDPANWTTVEDYSQLKACKNPLMLEIPIPVTDKQLIRVCNVWADDFNFGPVETPTASPTVDIAPIMAWTPARSEKEIGGRLASQAVENLQSYFVNVINRSTNRTILFSTVSDVTVGAYIGANLLNPSVAGTFFNDFLAVLFGPGIADNKAALIQACDGRNDDQIFGLIAASSPNLTMAYDAVSLWSRGECVDTTTYRETLEVDSKSIGVVDPSKTPTPSSNPGANSDNSTGSNNATSPAVRIMLQPAILVLAVLSQV
ncbi:chitinase [Colletotrichum truncatum]|uniref:Chitinase n=1 Tax=Colletotrichum truncatum TaxID=5467 RepID=A0ACC3YE54_COLTU|nr:chitinase [Colletotrichum truncatum]KAF6790194.1 chitinase [Colletotrichum truncatum]